MSFLKKILGFVLLFGGLVVIIYALFSSYNIFTVKNQPPEVFTAGKESVLPQQSQDLQVQMQKLIQEQLKGMLPADSIPKLFNLISWSIFASILILGGGQIAGLGIKLIK